METGYFRGCSITSSDPRWLVNSRGLPAGLTSGKNLGNEWILVSLANSRPVTAQFFLQPNTSSLATKCWMGCGIWGILCFLATVDLLLSLPVSCLDAVLPAVCSCHAHGNSCIITGLVIFCIFSWSSNLNDKVLFHHLDIAFTLV